MTEAEFHKARRMFAVIDGTLLVAPPDHGCTHYEWFRSLLDHRVLAHAMANCARGYVLDDHIRAYQGVDFSARLHHPTLLTAVNMLEAMYRCQGVLGGPLHTIGFGAVDPGDSSQPWPAKRTMTIDNYRIVVAHMGQDVLENELARPKPA